jgi:hypothetical protein
MRCRWLQQQVTSVSFFEKTRARIRSLVFGLVVFAGIAVQAFAQGGATGAIDGTVKDSTGAVVVGANIQVLRTDTGELFRSGTTNTSGQFTLNLMPPGTYAVTIEATGFSQTVLHNVIVRVTETTRLPVILRTATVQEKVEVQSEAEQVKTTDASIGAALSGNTIQEIPLATRNFQQLLALSAGAASSLNSASQLGRGDVHIAVNGSREDNNSYQIDGIGANDNTNAGSLANTPLPSPDAIQEFKFSTSLYDATQGRNGGGNVNAILKSGTKDYHFDLFEYFRNTALNANDYFLKQQGLPRPDIKQNIFGGGLGGPVGPKGQLGFFFVNYQGTRQRSGDSPGTIISTVIPYVPAADRTSIAALANAFAIPAANIDPVAFNIISAKSNQFGSSAGGYLYPLPSAPAGTQPGTLVPFRVSSPGKFTDDQFMVNWDRDFRGGKDRLSWRWFFSDSDTFQPFGADSYTIIWGTAAQENNLNFPMRVPLRNRFGSLTESHLFTNRVLNELRFGVNVIHYKNINQPPVTAEDVGIVRPTNNVSSDIYRLLFASAGFSMGPMTSSPTDTLSDSWTFLDTLSWVLGKHSLRFGGQIDHIDIRRYLPINDTGFLFFDPGASPFTGQAYSDFQNFLIGNLGPGGFINGGLTNNDYKEPSFSFFGQDDWRATQALTLNLGFRLDLNGAPYTATCAEGNLDPALLVKTGQGFYYPKCADRYHLPGVIGTDGRSGLDNNYATVMEPRIGFAYDVMGHHTTAIRGGYGMYSVREDVGILDVMILTPPWLPLISPIGVEPGGLGRMFTIPPNVVPPVGQTSPRFVPTTTLFRGFSASGACNGDWTADTTNGFPCFSGNLLYDLITAIPRRFVSPTTQQWNLTVQRSLGRNWALQLGYIGTKGTHLREINQNDQARLASPQQPIMVTVKDPNSPNFGTTYAITQNTASNIYVRLPYLGMYPYAYYQYAADANSHYHAFEATVSHRISTGLYFQSAYTFSKSIDDTSTSSVAFGTRLNDQTSGPGTRGLSDFEHKHRWITSFDYVLPSFAQDHGFFGHLFSGWGTNGVFTLQSGAPFSVFDSLGGTAYGMSSADAVTAVFAPGFNCSNAYSSGSTTDRLNGYLNTQAFLPALVVPNSPDGLTGFGNVQRNCFHGPRQFNIDFSVSKTFKFGEHENLKFATEFFNLANTPSFSNPVPTDIETAVPGSRTFGPINRVIGTPRLVQFALRFAF